MTRPIILHTILNAALFFFFLKLFSRSIGITNHIHNPIITDIIIFQCLRNKETNEEYRFLYSHNLGITDSIRSFYHRLLPASDANNVRILPDIPFINCIKSYYGHDRTGRRTNFHRPSFRQIRKKKTFDILYASFLYSFRTMHIFF